MRRLAGRKLVFEGVTVVPLPDECTREAVRLFRGPHGVMAVLQRNGNVGLSRTGLFEHPDSARAKLRTAQCLRGLKLISADMLALYQQLYEADEHKKELRQLHFDAECLGYSIVKLQKTKLVKRTYRSRTKL